MNILMVTNSFITDRIGGSERYLSELAQSLQKGGHILRIITGQYNRMLPLVENYQGLRVVKYKVRSRNFFICSLSIILGAWRVAQKLIGEKRPDIIVYHQPQATWGVLLFQPKIASVYHFHASWRKEFLAITQRKKYRFGLKSLTKPIWIKFLPFLMKKLELFCLNRVGKIITLSEYTKREVLSLSKALERKIEVIPGGVDTSRFAPAVDKKKVRKLLGIKEPKFIILTVRRLHPRMGLLNLIESIRLIKKHSSLVQLLIIGEGPLRENLMKYIKETALQEKVKLLGKVNDDLLPRYYQAADLFIIPTFELEGFGLVILEALASGLPVIGTRVGAIPELLTKLEGWEMVSTGSPEDLAEKIEKIIHRTQESNPSTLRQFIERQYAWPKIAQRVERVYKRVIKEWQKESYC
jgi:glycosyltransferase involved in cell wall biosynthesis